MEFYDNIVRDVDTAICYLTFISVSYPTAFNSNRRKTPSKRGEVYKELHWEERTFQYSVFVSYFCIYNMTSNSLDQLIISNKIILKIITFGIPLFSI